MQATKRMLACFPKQTNYDRDSSEVTKVVKTGVMNMMTVMQQS